MISLQEVLAFTEPLYMPVCFWPEEIEAMYNCAVQVGAGETMVEIGVFGGRSASVLLQVARDSWATVVLIDPWVWMESEGKPAFFKMIGQFSDVHYKVIPDYSYKAAQYIQGLISLVHIDGDHTGPGVRMDCELYLPKLKSGGFALFHDYKDMSSGVEAFPELREEVDKATAGWEVIGDFGRLAVRRKP